VSAAHRAMFPRLRRGDSESSVEGDRIMASLRPAAGVLRIAWPSTLPRSLLRPRWPSRRLCVLCRRVCRSLRNPGERHKAPRRGERRPAFVISGEALPQRALPPYGFHERDAYQRLPCTAEPGTAHCSDKCPPGEGSPSRGNLMNITPFLRAALSAQHDFPALASEETSMTRGLNGCR